MSTPPKYFAALQAREETGQLTRLEKLADRWERHAENVDARDEFGRGIRTAYDDVAKELRDFIEDARA